MMPLIVLVPFVSARSHLRFILTGKLMHTLFLRRRG
jgi:hypothetical protein